MRKMTAAGLIAALAFVAAGTARADTTPALVLDAGSRQVLHAEDAGRPWYPASLTKLMTALVTFEALDKGEVSLDTPVVMTKQAMAQASLHAGLKVGSTMRLGDALYAAFAASANEVAYALAGTVAGSQKAFVARMNDQAGRLGLDATHYVNSNGLFDPNQHVSARDLAILALTIEERYPQYRGIFDTARVTFDGKPVDSFNELLTRFPGATGMKTGFLCAAGRNLVALADRGGKKVMVVLLGATTGRERAERAAKFMTEAFSGALKPTGRTVSEIADEPQRAPEDMRMRLCSNETAPYEAARDKLYPMGLPGHESYLSAPTPPTTHAITTWMSEPRPDVPVPTPRPSEPVQAAAAK